MTATASNGAVDALVAALVAQCARYGIGASHRVCVGLSGGCDSVVLLHLLARLARAGRFRLSAVHVDHQLNPRSAVWADACRAHCEALGVPLQIAKVRVVRAGHGLEAAARQARHAVFDALEADICALAHHADDQAETLLLRLTRGAGVRGAAGMAPFGADTRPARWRPLLSEERAALRALAMDAGWSWVEDESNADCRLDRNAVRHRILPRLTRWRAGSVAALGRAAAHFREADSLLADLAALDGADCGGDPLQLARLRMLDDARLRNLLRYRVLGVGLQPGSDARLGETVRQLRCATGTALALPFGEALVAVYRERVWVLPALATPAPQTWSGHAPACLPWALASLDIRSAVGEGLSAARIARAASLQFDVPRPGMTLRCHPKRPARVLRKAAQLQGLPPWLRPQLPVLWADEAPLWVGGIGIADHALAKPGEPAWVIRWPVPAGLLSDLDEDRAAASG